MGQAIHMTMTTLMDFLLRTVSGQPAQAVFLSACRTGFEREIAKRLAYWDRLRKVKSYGRSDETD